MNNFENERYENLIKCFRKVENEVLGKDYYNYGCDETSCNQFACDDLIYNFKRKKKTIIFQRILIIISWFVIGVLLWKI
jgi:hypothetical protein